MRVWLDILVVILVTVKLILTGAPLDWFDAFMCFSVGVAVRDLFSLFFDPDLPE